ncbi:hypothetical protein CsSME_00018143 [Camellia sinensis var. sinensis]
MERNMASNQNVHACLLAALVTPERDRNGKCDVVRVPPGQAYSRFV